MNLSAKDRFAGDQKINYIYDAAGIKMQKRVYHATSHTVPIKITSYAGNYIYEKESTTESLQFFSHTTCLRRQSDHRSDREEGINVEKNGTGFEYVYQYKDHLGNVRLSYQDMNNSGSEDSSEIKEENNYYPFGLKMKGFNNVVTGRDHKYGFGDKEEQDELGLEWMDFHARNYDASLGRWMNIDPLAEQFYDTSPYTYVSNNPLRYDDPTGMAQEDVILRGSQADIDRTTTLIENATTGHYTASVDSNGQLSLTANSISGPAMSEKGKAAVKEIQGLIMSETVTEVDIVSNDINVEVGSIKNNALDIADIEQFDAAGSIGRSSIGALVHELVEQKAKVKAGGIKGVQPIPLKAESMHQRGIEAGNRVDNNRRGFNKNQYFFLESNGEITQELWLTPVNGTININKLNKGKPPVGFIEKT